MPENNGKILLISIVVLLSTYAIDVLLAYVSGFYYIGNGERLQVLLYHIVSPFVLYLYAAIILVRLSRPHYYIAALGVGFCLCVFKLLQKLFSNVDISQPIIANYISDYAQIALPFLLFSVVGYIYQNRKDSYMSSLTAFRTLNAYVVIAVFVVLVAQNRWYVQRDYFQKAERYDLVSLNTNNAVDDCRLIMTNDYCKARQTKSSNAICEQLLEKNFCQ